MSFPVLKTVKFLHSNNNSFLPDNNSPFRNSRVNNLKTTKTNKAAEITAEMVLSTPRDSLWRP